MFIGSLQMAFDLSEKHRMNVSTVTELQKIVHAEIGHTPQLEDKVLTQILQLIENNKQYLREVK